MALWSLVAWSFLATPVRAGSIVPANPRLHPNSISHTSIELGADRVRVALRFQALTLHETLPLDENGDEFLSPRELEEGRLETLAYLSEGLLLAAPPGSEPLELVPWSLEILEEEDPGLLAGYRWVEAVFEADLPLAVDELEVTSTVFLDSNVGHSNFLRVTFGGEEPWSTLLGSGYQSEVFLAASKRRPSVFSRFWRLGLDHILGGYDHLAFLLALLVVSRALRSLVGVVTAFTLAHSITLAAAALGWVVLPARWIELAIALSIAYVGVDNLLRKEARTPWLEAFGFGLLHGFGFASFLGEALSEEPLIATALLGFNLGVEVGQLAVVVAATLIFMLFLRWIPNRSRAESAQERAGLVPSPLRTTISIAVALCGFYWFVERAGWI